MKIISLTVIIVFVAKVFGFAQQGIAHPEEHLIIEQLNQRTQIMMNELSDGIPEYYIFQYGAFNQTIVSQETQTAESIAGINITQSGYLNSIHYFDSGVNNYLNLSQNGLLNSAELITDDSFSLFNIGQSGSKNLILGVLQGNNMALYNIEQDNQSNSLLIIDDKYNKINGLEVRMTGNMTMIIRNGF